MFSCSRVNTGEGCVMRVYERVCMSHGCASTRYQGDISGIQARACQPLYMIMGVSTPSAKLPTNHPSTARPHHRLYHYCAHDARQAAWPRPQLARVTW